MGVDGSRSEWTVVNNSEKINSTSKYKHTCTIVMSVSRINVTLTGLGSVKLLVD
jgi:hypothetical protein